MHAPNAERLLRLWDETRSAHPIRQALGLLEAAWPETDAATWARVPIGARDARLLDIHDAWFGAELQTATDCTECHARLEAAFPASAIRIDVPASLTQSAQTLRHKGYEIAFRLPNSDDLLEAAQLDDAEDSQQIVLQRCIEQVRHAEAPHPSMRLPAAIAAKVGAEMARLDPGADVEIRLRCPSCGHEQEALFDIVAYLRGEFDDWAQRTLADVHVLARAYGWNEHDILALSPARRRCYVEMVCA